MITATEGNASQTQPKTQPKTQTQAGTKAVSVRLDLLSRDESVQARAALHRETVAEYAEAMADGAEFPPLVVFDDGEKLLLADGFHRAEAARAAGLEAFPCEVRVGTRRDAILFAVGANARHGLRRTDADKRLAVETLLKDEEWGRWSDREIARLAGVGKTLVNKTRRMLTPELTGGPRLARRGEQIYEIKPARQAPALVVTAAATKEARGDAPDVAADWRHCLVRFSTRQFTLWQGVVSGRTDESIWARAVGAVMRIT